MSKGNSRSFRYSDMVKELLEQAEGNNLNEKFENLVRYCHDAVPKVKKDLTYWKTQCEKQRATYYDLCAKLQEVRLLMDTLQQLEQYGQQAAKLAQALVESEV